MAAEFSEHYHRDSLEKGKEKIWVFTITPKNCLLYRREMEKIYRLFLFRK